MMAVVNSAYRFLYVDAGSNGRVSDGGVFGQCSFKRALSDGSLHLPSPTVLTGTNHECPYMFLADEAFPMCINIMKPYPRRNMDIAQRIFNYRLSRARRTVENAFGILANRFRVFLTNVCLQPSTIEKVVHASCILHNFLRTKSEVMYLAVDEEDTDHHVAPGAWRDAVQLTSAVVSRGRNPPQEAKVQRDMLADYFHSGAGQVPWQNHMI